MCISAFLRLGCLLCLTVFLYACSDEASEDIGDASQYGVTEIQALMDAGDVQKAFTILREKQTSRSASAEEYILLADIYLASLNGVAAEVAIERARLEGMLGKTTALKMARALMLQGKLDGAQAELSSIELSGADGFDALLMQGQIAQEKDDFELAERMYTLAQEMNVNAVQLYSQWALFEADQGNWPAAKDHAEKVLSLDEENYTAHYLLGAIARQDGQYEEALSHVTASLEISPDYYVAALELVGLYLDMDDLPSAEGALAKVLSVNPGSPLARFYVAFIENEKGNTAVAEDILLRAGPLLGSYMPAKRLYGHVAYDLEKYDIAAKYLEQTIARLPDDRESRLKLSESLRKTGRHADALQVMQVATGQEAQDPAAAMEAAAANLALGNPEAAIKHHDKAVEIAKQANASEEVLKNLKVSQALTNYMAGNRKEAIKAMQEVVAVEKPDPAELATLANMQMSDSDLNGTLKTIARLKAIAPGDPVAYNLEGSIAYRKGRHKDSIIAYTKALDINPDYPSARKNRAVSYMMQKQVAEAKADLEYLTTKHEISDPQVFGMLGNAYLLLDEFRSAVKAYKEALVYAPDNVTFMANYAHALGESGLYDEALKMAGEAMELAPGNKNLETYLQPLIRKYQAAKEKQEE